MEVLVCPYTLAGDHKARMKHDLQKYNQDNVISNYKSYLLKKTKTKPEAIAVKAAALMGSIYNNYGGDPRLLHCLIQALKAIDPKAKTEKQPL